MTIAQKDKAKIEWFSSEPDTYWVFFEIDWDMDQHIGTFSSLSAAQAAMNGAIQ